MNPAIEFAISDMERYLDRAHQHVYRVTRFVTVAGERWRVVVERGREVVVELVEPKETKCQSK